MRTPFLLVATLLAMFASAQDRAITEPLSWQLDVPADMDSYTTGAFDRNAALLDDAVRDERGKLPLYARFLPVGVASGNAGTWTVLPNGDAIWRLRITSPQALATELFFTDVVLPAGSTLHIHDAVAHFEGPYIAEDVASDGRLSTVMILGATSIVEYYEPAAVRGQGQLTVQRLAHAYRFIAQERSDPCEVDVNCSEATGWEALRDAVMRIRVVASSGNGFCTGTLMNNTAQDCRPFILTAFHCGEDSDDADMAQYQFRFNYQRTGCATGTVPGAVNSTMAGCTLRAHSNDDGGNEGSDFMLLELNAAPLASYNAYYAGWDAANTAPSAGKCIHHPDGDMKKVSTYTAPAFNTGWGVSNSHWGVRWVATANGHGVTEPGSSGSPLFNTQKRLVGTLTGGASCCTVNGCDPGTGPGEADYYGKLSYHWTNNPNTAGQKLRAWLSPGSTSITTLDGSYNPCSPIGMDERAQASLPVIYPNPATTSFTVQHSVLAERLEVTDVSGRVVYTTSTGRTDRTVLDASSWAAGTYFVRLAVQGVLQPAGKLSVQR